MGSFANTVFSLLLGWLQTVASMIWNSLTEKDNESIFQFIGRNWILITLILCLAGLVIDFAVYLFRWEPYKVWMSFWKKISSKEHNEETVTGSADDEEKESFSQNTFDSEPVFPAEYESGNNAYADTGDTDSERFLCSGDVIKQETASDEKTENLFRRDVRNRHRRRFNSILGDTGDEELHYYNPRPMMDEKDAYHAPVYPEKWRENREQDT